MEHKKTGGYLLLSSTTNNFYNEEWDKIEKQLNDLKMQTKKLLDRINLVEIKAKKLTNDFKELAVFIENIEEPKEEKIWESLGEFKLTAYCTEKYPHICNSGPPYTTRSGTIPSEHTISVDPEVIPLGSVIKIDDIEYIAEDTGGDILNKRIDICMKLHETALKFGVQYKEVFIERIG